MRFFTLLNFKEDKVKWTFPLLWVNNYQIQHKKIKIGKLKPQCRASIYLVLSWKLHKPRTAHTNDIQNHKISHWRTDFRIRLANAPSIWRVVINSPRILNIKCGESRHRTDIFVSLSYRGLDVQVSVFVTSQTPYILAIKNLFPTTLNIKNGELRRCTVKRILLPCLSFYAGNNWVCAVRSIRTTQAPYFGHLSHPKGEIKRRNMVPGYC